MKSLHNITVTRNGIIEIEGASTSGKLRFNTAWEYSNNDGVSWSVLGSTAKFTKLMIVDPTSGVDATSQSNADAKKGDIGSPFKTIKNAIQYASETDLVYVMAGNYNESNILKTGANPYIYFAMGAVVQPTTAAPILRDNSVGTTAPATATIRGYGRFIVATSTVDTNNHAVVANNTGSFLDIEALEISSYKVYGSARVKIANAKIGGSWGCTVVGESAKLTIDNCTIVNNNPAMVYLPKGFYCSIRNSKLEQVGTSAQVKVNMQVKSDGGGDTTPNTFYLSNCLLRNFDKTCIEVGPAAADGATFVLMLEDCKLYQSAIAEIKSIVNTGNVGTYKFMGKSYMNYDCASSGGTIENYGHGALILDASLKID
jgi:hypothetical protein